MIELAPQHKMGLALKNQIMPTAGFFGYGQNPYPNLIQPRQFGAIVTNPITLRPEPHQAKPQIKEMMGGVIFNTPPRNPGVRKIIQKSQKTWKNRATPVIAHLPCDDPDDLGRTVRALDGLAVLAGFELGIPPQFPIPEIRSCINAVLYNCEIPLIIKLTFDEALLVADNIIGDGVDALTISMVPQCPMDLSIPAPYLEGDYYGLGAAIHGLPVLTMLRNRYPEVPLIASGGIHSIGDVNYYLQAGATAVQLDTIIFIDPLAVQQMLDSIQTDSMR